VFRLGPASLRLAQIYQAGFALGDETIPVLRALAHDTGETASLYVRDGAERVCLFRVEADRPVRAHVREGDRRPLDRGAAGKVLRIFAGETLPEGPHVQAQRYAVSRGEVSPESAALAVPVFGAGSRLLGALNLSLPVQRLTAKIEADLAPRLRRAGDDLSRRLGGAPA
jgi:DNA-binding IclR family transcriptional regulator